jgi:hypothetical protein
VRMQFALLSTVMPQPHLQRGSWSSEQQPDY